MYNTLTELFLSTYFMFDAVAGRLVRNPKILFDRLFPAFCLPEQDREALFAHTQKDEVKEIEAYGDYAQVCRIQKYAEISEIESGIAPDTLATIAVKGGALRKVKQFGYEEFAPSTEAESCKILTESANMGLVSSLCALGFLQCEGIFVAKNTRLGIKNLERAAKWNSIEGILLSLCYDEKHRALNLDRLYTVTRGTIYEDVYAAAEGVYECGREAHVLQETRMLAKAFGLGIAKPDLYTAQSARFIYSEIIGLKDKERVLFSGHQEMIAETVDLPLKLTCKDIAFDNAAFGELPLLREKEQEAICRAVINSDMRRDAAYRPLCVVGDSSYLLGLYLTAMEKAFPSAHIEKIEVADLGEYDVEPTKHNVFVRSCDEDRQNVYILNFKGEIKEPVMSLVKSFLQSDKRGKFRLLHPNAIIDLGAVLPICFCDRQNARLLKSCCDVVTLDAVSEAEKADILAYIIREKAGKYKIANTQIEQAAQELLMTYSVDRAETVTDRVVRCNRNGAALVITADMVNDSARSEAGAKNKYGFGDTDNEGK